MFSIKNESGVTLIELLVSVAILSIVLLMATNLFSYSMKAYKNDDIQMQIQQDARLAIKKISQEVRSKEILNNIGQSPTLKLQYTDSNGNIVTQTIQRGDSINNNMSVLYLRTNSTFNPIIKNVDDINFNYDGSILTVDLTTQRLGASNKYSISAKLYSRIDD